MSNPFYHNITVNSSAADIPASCTRFELHFPTQLLNHYLFLFVRLWDLWISFLWGGVWSGIFCRYRFEGRNCFNVDILFLPRKSILHFVFLWAIHEIQKSNAFVYTDLYVTHMDQKRRAIAQSTFAIPAESQCGHPTYIINHHKRLSHFMPVYIRLTVQIPDFS